MSNLAGVSLLTLENALTAAAMQVETLRDKYPVCEALEVISLDIQHSVERLEDEIKAWRRRRLDVGDQATIR